jgi:5-methylcytosine-specific restriction enzyme subunit McrC
VKSIRLKEHESALVVQGPDDTRFTFSEIEALDRVQRATKVDAFRWTGRNQISTGQYVGVLASAGARLEILPKIDSLGEGETRRVLMRMIGTAWDVRLWDGELTGHDYQNSDLLELLVRLFAQRLRIQLRAGLSRAYCRHEDDLSRLRGKMDVTRQFTKLAASPRKLACRYDEFTADTSLNRLLLCAVILLRRKSVRAGTQRLLNEIVAHFSDVQMVSASDALAGKFMLDRVNQRWKILATLARLFLLSEYQTAHGGNREGIALLFDMNVLFESYVAALARKACLPLGYEVSAQGPQDYLTCNRVFKTIPDLHCKCGQNVFVLDTKWKKLDPGKPNHGANQTDAFQMHAYAHVYKSCATILLYPHHSGIPAPPGEKIRWQFKSGGSDLVLATIDVAKPPDELEGALRLLLESPEEVAGRGIEPQMSKEPRSLRIFPTIIPRIFVP